MSPHESTNQALRRLGYHRVDHLAQRPRDADAQFQFARELERHPEALTAWRRYHAERHS